jgi:hypothetical protein
MQLNPPSFQEHADIDHHRVDSHMSISFKIAAMKLYTPSRRSDVRSAKNRLRRR